MVALELPNNNLKIIDFNELFVQQIQVSICDDLHKYNLIGKPLKHKDVKKIIYHHLIHGICQCLLQPHNNKPVFIYNDIEIVDCDVCNIFSKSELLVFIKRFLHRLEKMLPVKVCILRYKITRPNTSNFIAVNACISKSKSVDLKLFSFDKIKKFAKQYELTFLNSDYLERLKTKQILIR
jgi:hypothetical protein